MLILNIIMGNNNTSEQAIINHLELQKVKYDLDKKNYPNNTYEIEYKDLKCEVHRSLFDDAWISVIQFPIGHPVYNKRYKDLKCKAIPDKQLLEGLNSDNNM